MNTVFEISGLSAGIAGKTLLRRLTLVLGLGDCAALTGPSGCGKTTLLRTLAGLIEPLEGEFRFEGIQPAGREWPPYRRRAPLVEQRPAFFDASVRENFERLFTYRSAGGRFNRDTAAQLLNRLGLDADTLEQNALSLSEGQRQRVALVRALLVEPRVLLLDEPTSALDADSVRLAEDMIRAFTEGQGGAALIVTHNIEQAKRLAHRIVDLAPHMDSAPEGAA